MHKSCRSFIAAIGAAVMAMASFASEVFLIAVRNVSAELTPQKLDVELAQNVAHKVTDSAKPVSVGSGSGESALSFVSMLKAINSRSLSAAA